MSKYRVLTVSLCLSVGSIASAQSDVKPAPPPREAPLGGPSVTPRDVPGVDGQFGQSPDGLRRRLAERIPARVIKQALGAITGDDAPAEIKATPEQREKLEQIQRDFEQQAREYVRTHRDELMEIRAKLPADGPISEMLRRYGVDSPRDGAPARRRARAAEGDAPAAQDAQPAPGPEAMSGQPGQPPRRPAEQIPPEMQDRVRELLEGMPQPEQALTKVWRELTPKQREAVEARLTEYRERQAKMREEAYVKQRTGAGAPGQPQGQTPPPARRRPDGTRIQPEGRGEGDDMMKQADGQRPGEAGAPPRRPRAEAGDRRQRLMRLFESMTPEQQDQLLERLEGRMRETGGGAGRGRPDRGEPKPAPDMKDQPLPRPDEMSEPE